jgi:hypothetical protein
LAAGWRRTQFCDLKLARLKSCQFGNDNAELCCAPASPKHISTSFVERHNWLVRTSMRRYTRLSNGLSRKVENHAAAVALNYFAYNFIQIHRTLRMSPAMAAGVTDHLWSVADLVALWEREERRLERAA